jgi:Family of unknown function (DUF6220)
MRSGVTTAYHGLALLIAVGVVVQVFLAGLGIFGAESFDAHESFGWMLHTAAIVLFLLALLGPRTGRTIGMAFGLLVLMTVQIMLVGARDDTPWLAALHPVLALFVLGLALRIGMPLLSRRRAAPAHR